MNVSNRALIALESIKCKNCKKKLPEWDNDVYHSWLNYISGKIDKDIVEKTRFMSRRSLRRYFIKHPCFKKISKIRKKWFRSIKFKIQDDIENYPWLLGLYYADGSKSSSFRVSFGLASYERVIVKKITRCLKSIVGKDFLVSKDIIGNMISVRIHSADLVDTFPNKNNKEKFDKLWHSFNEKQKFEFVGGFIDGDGSCSFEDKIYSITLFSKTAPFIPKYFNEFLNKFGYTSINEFRLYISPKVGKKIMKFTLKRSIKKPYTGSVNTRRAWKLMQKGYSLRRIAKIIKKDKKTISIALKRVYGIDTVQPFLDKNKTH